MFILQKSTPISAASPKYRDSHENRPRMGTSTAGPITRWLPETNTNPMGSFSKETGVCCCKCSFGCSSCGFNILHTKQWSQYKMCLLPHHPIKCYHSRTFLSMLDLYSLQVCTKCNVIIWRNTTYRLWRMLLTSDDVLVMYYFGIDVQQNVTQNFNTLQYQLWLQWVVMDPF